MNKLSRRELLTSIAAAGGVTLSGCINSNGTSTDPSEDGYSSVSSLFIPSVSWNFDTQGKVGGSPSIAGGVLYVGSYDGYVYAFEEEGEVDENPSGEYRMFKYDLANTNAPDTHAPKENIAEKWKFPTDGLVYTAPAVADGNVYFGSEDHYFYSVSSETGDENWRINSGGIVGGSSPSVDDGIVYFASGDSEGSLENPQQSGRIYAVDAQDGTVVWTVEKDKGIQSSPVVDGDLLYHGCQDNNFYARDSDTGDEVWSFEADDVFCGCGAALKDGTVYVGSEDNSMYALDADDGRLVWEFKTDDIVTSSPVATKDAVYFGSHDNNLYAVGPETGDEIWRFDAGGSVFSSPAYRDGVVYVGSTDGNVYAVDGETGTEIWRYDTGRAVNSSPVVTENTVYIGSNDNKVYAIENKEVDEGTYREYKEKIQEGGIENISEIEEEVLEEVDGATDEG